MRSFKQPLWMLMVAVVVVGIGIAALRNPTELVSSAVFTLTVGFLCVAVLVAIATTGRKRFAYSAFSIFGGMYMLLIFGPFSSDYHFNPPSVLPTIWLTKALYLLDSQFLPPSESFLNTLTQLPQLPNTLPSPINQPSPIDTTRLSPGLIQTYQNSTGPIIVERESFYQVGHSLAALLIGFLASLTTLIVTGFRRK